MFAERLRERGLIAISIAMLAIARDSPDPPVTQQHVAVRIEPRSPVDLALSRALADDVWSEDPVVVVVAPAALDQLRAHGVPLRVVVGDLDAERRRLAHRATAGWFAEYRDNVELNAHLAALAEAHPTLASVRRVGSSIEGRPILAIEISHGGKLAVVLDGGHHAREWISVMVPTCIADRLATGYTRDARIRRILDATKLVIIPVINPDGYHHTWTVDRYWRKNRRGGYGVDLNRNYSVGWGGAGSSDDPRSPNYRGERPFSEPETQAMRDVFARDEVVAHVDFHAFSQVVVYPWSHQRADPPDRDELAAIADRMSTAMTTARDHRYIVRPGAQLQVGAGGTAGDWSYGTYGALSFLIELRPSSGAGGGFVLPPDQIVPTCDEAMAGVLELGDWLVDHASSMN